MKAPDKIYVTSFKPIINGVFAACEVKQSKNDTEYIRKDALLEWAKEKNEKIDTDEGDYSLGYISAMIDLIDKLSSM